MLLRKFILSTFNPFNTRNLINSAIYVSSSSQNQINDLNKSSDDDNINDNIPKGFGTNSVKKDFITTEDLYNFRERTFRDRVKLKVVAGKGGNGCVSYYRDRVVVSGAPDGGDGGRGGSFYFKATAYHQDLRIIKSPEFHGNDGKSGMRGNRDGRDGSDIHYAVPLGTLVWELKTIKKKDKDTEKDATTEINKKLLADLDEEGKMFMVAKGGIGGKGNGKHRGLKDPEKGTLGQDKKILLELKCLADIGLVGYPNAGKSTILATLTRAFPKIAPYPFTTLLPTVGKIKFIDEFMMTVADIPGLIEGSHQNKGLGHEFLRHIERTKVLLYVLDISSPDPYKEYLVLKQELDMYSEDFANKPFLVICNKTDLDNEGTKKVNDLSHELKTDVIGISAKYSLGLDQLVVRLREIVEGCRKNEQGEKIKSEY